METTKLIVTPEVKTNPSFSLSNLTKGDDVCTTPFGDEGQCNAHRAH